MTVNERIAQARAHFIDEISLRIFDKRVQVGADVKKVVLPDVLDFVKCKYNSLEKLAQYVRELQEPKREVYIYGAGLGCKALLTTNSGRFLNASSVTGLIDNNVKGERYGLSVISFSEFLAEHRGALVVNSVGIPAGIAIHEQCVGANVDVISLFETEKVWDQYFDFPAELGLVGENEVFVHAGCFNGNTQESYVNWFGTSYEKMVTFEPNEVQYQACKDALQKYPNVELVKAGLSDKNGTVKFELDVPGLSYISENGTEEIRVVSLDSYMGNGKVTFIALDIEGEELKALKGAEQIIRTQKPKLAVSIYHKPEDIYELPELIKSFRSDYKLYLRHYHLLDMAETVLYAL